MRSWSCLAALGLAACSVEAGKDVPPVTGSDPVVVDAGSQRVSIDPTRVPVVDSCEPGGLVTRTTAGWVCRTPAYLTPPAACSRDDVLRWNGVEWECSTAGFIDYVAGSGLTLTGNRFSLDIASATQQVPRPNVKVKPTVLESGSINAISATVGADGRPIVAYVAAGATSAVMVAICNNTACSTSALQPIAEGLGAVSSTAIAIGADGLPLVAYGEVYGSPRVYVAHCDNAACGTSTTETIDDTDGSPGLISLTIAADGLPLVTYRAVLGVNEWVLKMARCTTPTCSAVTAHVLSLTGGHQGDASSVAIGIDGFPIVAYYVEGTQTLLVAKCNDAACTPASATFSAIAGAMGLNPSLTIGNDGLPVIACFNWYQGDIRVYHCADRACATAPKETIFRISTASCGACPYVYPSVAIAPDGLPVLSFHDLNAGTLNVVKCQSADCAVNNVGTKISNATGVSAITIGADGLPLVAYAETSPASALAVMKCANPLCIPYWTRR